MLPSGTDQPHGHTPHLRHHHQRDWPRRTSPAAKTLAGWSNSSRHHRWSPWHFRAGPSSTPNFRAARLPRNPAYVTTAGSFAARHLARIFAAVLALEATGRGHAFELLFLPTNLFGGESAKGMSSNWVTLAAPWRLQGRCPRSRSRCRHRRSPPHCLPWPRSDWACRRRPDLVLRDEELERECTPPSSRPGTGRSRGISEPPASTTASKSFCSCSALTTCFASLTMLAGTLVRRPARRCETPRLGSSARHGGRSATSPS